MREIFVKYYIVLLYPTSAFIILRLYLFFFLKCYTTRTLRTNLKHYLYIYMSTLHVIHSLAAYRYIVNYLKLNYNNRE